MKTAVTVLVSVLFVTTVYAQMVVSHKWDDYGDGTTLWHGGTYAVATYRDGDLFMMSEQSGSNMPTSNFILIRVSNLKPGDSLSGIAVCRGLASDALMVGYWGQNETALNHFVSLDPYMFEFTGSAFDWTVPEGYESLAIAARVTAWVGLSRSMYIDSIEFTGV